MVLDIECDEPLNQFQMRVLRDKIIEGADFALEEQNSSLECTIDCKEIKMDPTELLNRLLERAFPWIHPRHPP